MTPQERLKLYETALIDWKKGLKMDRDKRLKNYIYHGFCHYFDQVHDVWIYDEFEEILPELYSQKPNTYYMFWFLTNNPESRITCLENAIKLTKETYNL